MSVRVERPCPAKKKTLGRSWFDGGGGDDDDVDVLCVKFYLYRGGLSAKDIAAASVAAQ